MKVLSKILMIAVAVLTLTSSAAFAENIAPVTLEDGNLILIASYEKDKAFYYANRKSVEVQEYATQSNQTLNYRISIDILKVKFSDEYYQKHGTYINAPYAFNKEETCYFQYQYMNDNYKIICINRNGEWKICWDIPSSYRHSAGAPMLSKAAEIAFVTACKKKFIGDTIDRYTGKPVIDKSLYNALGI